MSSRLDLVLTKNRTDATKTINKKKNERNRR